MEQLKLEQLKQWFTEYVATFYGSDDYINANIKLKEEHSYRVCDEMRYLTDLFDFDPDRKRTAEFIALFHDIGRFPQFKKYRTYNDNRTQDHCLMGTDVLKEHNILDSVSQPERLCIEQAIRYHGVKQLPDTLDHDCLHFCKLIRDADKIDIYYIVTEYYRQYRDDPGNFNIEIEFPDTPQCTPQIVEAVLNEQRVDYFALRTFNDMKLLQLSWVYDVNFVSTLRRIKQRRLLERVLEFLPDTEQIQKVSEKIFNYVDARIIHAD